ncbi:sugar phosphate nucleotidyltransferase [Eggerthellaceae bacterium 3-80]
MLTRQQFDALVAKYNAGVLTEEEQALLDPYKVKRAVLLASGFGSRLMPATKTTPKPLISVNGVRIIDSILDALEAADVHEIYIVVGYKGEQFEQLKDKYPTIQIIKNPLFDSTNNISSALVAKDHFQNAYVFESDLFVKNPEILPAYQYETNYVGVPVDQTPDWCFDVDDEGIIYDLHKGGANCYHMYGISYWDGRDGAQLAQDLPAAFEQDENRQRFWDDVPCVVARDNYTIHVRPVSFEDVDEIDTFDELLALDSSYECL